MAQARNRLIDHTGIGVADISRSARFYEAALKLLGVRIFASLSPDMSPADGDADEIGAVAFGVDYPVFWIDVFHPKRLNQHTAFRANSREAVDRIHREALIVGGTDNGAPGAIEGVGILPG